METRLARKEMQCELMRIMGRLWVKRYMRDSAWGGMCEDNIEVEVSAQSG